MSINAGETSTEKGNLRRRCQNFIRENKLLVLLICLIIVGIVIGASLVCVAPIILKRAARPYRLPSDIVPYHYNLEVKPYVIPDNSKFEGHVEIYVTCSKTTDLITLHSKDLKINEGSIKVRSINEDEDLKVLLVYYDTSNDLLLLRLLEDLKERHSYRIYIKYKGPLERGNSGFYITSYEDNEESTHYVASTSFEPDEARKAFPCFDEPAYKSTFNITLVRWKNTTSLSNMPRYRMEDRGIEWIADIFEKSMKMSTYLVAFVFCDYVGTTKGKITVWSPAHRKENAEYALNMSVKFLKFFEEKLQIPYPGPKLDMVPVEGLSSIGMENWGLIIYKESALLTSNDTRNEKDMFYRIAVIIAHEIAHQWFGNLVTAKWWSDLWLTEGITSYMRDIAEIELFPEMSKIDPSMLSIDNNIMKDCNFNTPLLSPVTSSIEANDKFDSVTYDKGRSVIRMVHKILGDTIFWKGIRRYLKSNAYETVEEADLWRYLTMAQSSRSDRIDLAEIMYSWTHLSGVPMVTIKRDYERSTATISQESCQSKITEHENDLWNIPLIFSAANRPNYFNKIKLLKKQNMTIEGMPRSNEWIMVTTDVAGHYFVNYDRENWNLLCKQLRLYHEIFDATERHKLLTEITYFEGMGNADIDLVFQCFLYVNEEREPEVFWKTVPFIKKYLNFFEQSRYNDWLREYIIYIWKNMYHKLKWKEAEKGFNAWESAVGIAVTQVLCKLRYAPCVEEALARYSTLKEKKADEIEINNYMEIVPLCTFVQNATEEEWNNVKKALFSEDFGTVYFILECSNNAAVVREELYASLNESVSSSSLLHNALSSSTDVFREYIYFIDDNFETFMADFTSEKGFQYMMKTTCVNAWKIEKLSQVFTRHSKNLTGSNAEILEALLKILKEKLEETKPRTKILKEWLEKKPWIEKE